MTDLLQFAMDFFNSDEWPFEQLEDRPVLRTAFTGKNGQFSCWLQVRQELQQICFYSGAPVRVPMEKIPLVLEFLARANYGMIIGNFEIDVRDGEVRYKTSIDIEGIVPSAQLLKSMVYANVLTMDRYFPGLMQVTFADVSAEKAIEAIESPPQED